MTLTVTVLLRFVVVTIEQATQYLELALAEEYEEMITRVPRTELVWPVDPVPLQHIIMELMCTHCLLLCFHSSIFLC